MWYSVLVATPLDTAYNQLLSTGVVGAIAIVLGFVVHRLYKSKEQQKKDSEEVLTSVLTRTGDEYRKLVGLKDAQEDRFRQEVQQLGREYHNELKELTSQLMTLMREKSTSEARVTEVLQQVVSVQGDVERTLNRFLERFDGGSNRGLPRR